MPSYELFEDGYQYDIIEANSLEDALEIAKNNVSWSNFQEQDNTLYVNILAVEIETGEKDSATVVLDPPEPDCCNDSLHKWEAPFEVVGGCKENPGVWGNGGGVIIIECCANCGCKRTTDTWSQNPTNGQQGFTSVHYDKQYYVDDPDWKELYELELSCN